MNNPMSVAARPSPSRVLVGIPLDLAQRATRLGIVLARQRRGVDAVEARDGVVAMALRRAFEELEAEHQSELERLNRVDELGWR